MPTPLLAPSLPSQRCCGCAKRASAAGRLAREIRDRPDPGRRRANDCVHPSPATLSRGGFRPLGLELEIAFPRLRARAQRRAARS
ncbi:hypothetical protein ACU4GD_21175 [Cupriavidus basilensis]